MMSAEAKQSQIRKSVSKSVVKVIGNIVFVILLLILALMTVFMIQSRVNSSKTFFNGYRSYIVLSGSMYPAFDTGSLVIVKSILPEDLKEGDIVTFKSINGSSNTTTHRIVEVHNEDGLSFTTKGDANNVIDPARLMPEQVIGKVCLAIPYAGYILNFASTRIGTYLLVILPLTLIIIFEFFRIMRSIRKRKESTDSSKDVQIEEILGGEFQDDKEEMDLEDILKIADQPSENGKSEPGHSESKEEQKRQELITMLQKIHLDIEKKQADILALEKMLAETSVSKPEILSVISDMVIQSQLQWTEKLYNYKVQIAELERELQKAAEGKKAEEKKLDRTVALLKEELMIKNSDSCIEEGQV